MRTIEVVRIINLTIQIWGSAMLLIFIICMLFPNRPVKSVHRYYINLMAAEIGAMVSDAIAYIFRGRSGTFAGIMVVSANFLSFLFTIHLSYIFLKYEKAYIENKTHQRISSMMMKTANVLLVVNLAFLVINLFHPFLYQIDSDHLYHRMAYYPLIFLNALGSLLIGLYELLKYRKYLKHWEFTMFFIYIMIPLVSTIATLFLYGMALGQFGVTAALIIVYVLLQSEYGRAAVEQERELMENQTDMMLSQIQPHFLFNALNTIEFLCSTDSPDAAAAVEHFEDYMKMNVYSLTSENKVSLQQELKYLDNYLYIEHFRFPHIQVNFQLEATDFQLPPLTLQPLVENSIKHGLRQKKQDACILVKTEESKSHYILTVTDNGCGFDTKLLNQLNNGSEENSNPRRSHIGLTNIEKRLNLVSGGTLDIQSTPGYGTSAVIRIPKDNP